MKFFIKEKCPFKKENCSFNFYDSFEELPPSKKTELLIKVFQKKWVIPLYASSLGLAIIFIIAVYYAFFGNIENQSTFEKIFSALQIWVGFLLGIIATIFSVISMYLSFYNLEQQNDAEKRVIKINNDLITTLKTTLNDIILTELRKDLTKIHSDLKTQINRIPNPNQTEANITNLEGTIITTEIDNFLE